MDKPRTWALGQTHTSTVVLEGPAIELFSTLQVVSREDFEALKAKLAHSEQGRTLAHQEAERRLSEWSKCQGRISELESQIARLKQSEGK